MKRTFSISKFFLKVASLIVIFFVVVFASPMALDINSHKADFENKFSTLLNTNVKIEGDIGYVFNLGPQLKFENIIFDAGENNTLNGNIKNLKLSVNPFKLFKKEFSFKNFAIENGSLSMSEVFFKSYIQNQSQFTKIKFKNIDLKIANNLAEIEFVNNNGVFLFNSQNLTGVQLEGLFANSAYNLKYKNSKLDLNIPEFKLSLIYENKNTVNQKNFIEIKYSQEFLFPGLKNIYLRSNILFDENTLEFESLKISSASYNGLGVMVLKKENDNLEVDADLNFGRSNFLKIKKSNWVSFFNKELFQIASLINGNFKISFKHIFLNQNYFDDLNLDVSFNGGDIILNRVQFVSDKNSLNLSGRLVQENNDSLLFFESSFETQRLKRLCIQTCKSKAKSNNYTMKVKGTLNLKKSKFTIVNFVSTKEYDQSQIKELNQKLKTIFFGDLAKTFVIKNYFKLY